jgi:hypothetical protein
MKVLNPQNPQNGDVSRVQIVKSKLEGVKGFFRISTKEDDKSLLQYICVIIGIVSLFLCIFWYDDWLSGTKKTEHMIGIAFLAFLTIGTFIGGKPTILVVFSLIMVFGFSYFLISGKTPVDIYSEKAEKTEQSANVRFIEAETKVKLLASTEITKADFYIPANRKIFFRSPEPFYVIQVKTNGAGYWEEAFPAGQSVKTFSLAGDEVWLRSFTPKGGYTVAVSY